MKSIKLFGLAALTALMAMALIGASSAMAEATTLCEKDENPCAAANAVNNVHEVSVGTATLLSSVLNVTCAVLFSGSAVNGTTTPQEISGNFTYSSCNSNCVVTEENSPSTIKVLKTGHETAEVTGEGLVHVNCSGFLNCVYNGIGLKGTGKGPLLSTQTNGEVSLKEQTTNKESGSLCPKTAKLDIVTTPLKASYIEGGSGAAMRCESFAGGLYASNLGGGVCGEDVEATFGQFEINASKECVKKAGGLYEDSACVKDVKETHGQWELLG